MCEQVQHLSMFDFIAVTGTLENRVIEYVDHLHEHFAHPVVVNRGRYMPPLEPGYGTTIRPESRAAYRYPDGEAWRAETAVGSACRPSDPLTGSGSP